MNELARLLSYGGKIYIITVCHMEPEIIAFSLARALKTMGYGYDRWIFVDNHWPITKYLNREVLEDVSQMICDREIIRPEKNVGGHGGVNFALNHLKIKPEDLVLIYDPDSNPVTPGWLSAMVTVMANASHIDCLGLMIDPAIIVSRLWNFKHIAGIKVASDKDAEMMNITMIRGSALIRTHGMQAFSSFYGGVEASMHSKGIKSAYLYDYREQPCPIAHPEIYRVWKLEHATGRYKGNFDQYVEEAKIKLIYQ